MNQQVILVTEKDEPIGTMGKMEVHTNGLLHRAFSVFIFDKQGRMLLQQRAPEKYHGARLWSNTCCSHPLPGEDVQEAAARRLQEEMGFTTSLQKLFEFTYRIEVENNLIENEYDHVFTGIYEGVINANKEEVADHSYVNMGYIKWLLKKQPSKFTIWFQLAFPAIEKWWLQEFGGKNK